MDRRAKRREKKRQNRAQAKKEARSLAARRPSELTLLLRSAARGAFGPCFVSSGWDDPGSPALVTVVVTRRLPTGELVPGTALVDRTCLGIKNAFASEPLEPRELTDYIAQLAEAHGGMLPCEPIVAQSVVFHARDYAQSLGFEPHRDFPAALFGPRPEVLVDTPWHAPEKPIYLSGPYDDTSTILSRLEKAVGFGNFEHIDLSAELSAEDEDEDFDLDDEIEHPLVHSPLERTVSRHGQAVQIYIYRGPQDAGWILELEDQTGGSTVWDGTFATDQAALDEAMRAIEQDGIASFSVDAL